MNRTEYLEARGWEIVNDWGDVTNPNFKEWGHIPVYGQRKALELQLQSDIQKLGGYEKLIELTQPKGGYIL